MGFLQLIGEFSISFSETTKLELAYRLICLCIKSLNMKKTCDLSDINFVRQMNQLRDTDIGLKLQKQLQIIVDKTQNREQQFQNLNAMPLSCPSS